MRNTLPYDPQVFLAADADVSRSVFLDFLAGVYQEYESAGESAERASVQQSVEAQISLFRDVHEDLLTYGDNKRTRVGMRELHNAITLAVEKAATRVIGDSGNEAQLGLELSLPKMLLGFADLHGTAPEKAVSPHQLVFNYSQHFRACLEKNRECNFVTRAFKLITNELGRSS